MQLLDFIFRRKPSPDQFAKLFIAEARKAGYSEPLTYQADGYKLLHGSSSVFFLHNAYQTYCRAPRGQRRQALSSFIASMSESQRAAPASLSEAKPLLRPVIRSRGMLEDLRMEEIQTKGSAADFSPIYRPFGEDCAVLLALDYPHSISMQTRGPDASWGIAFDEAMTIALDNLRDTPERFKELMPGVYQGAWSDGYDTSRALLPDMLQRVGVRGQPIFMMPTRDVLLVTGDRDDKGLLGMLSLATEAAEGGRRISAQMYRHGEHGVETFTPSNARLARQLTHFIRLYSKANYDSQKIDLDRIHEQAGMDLFVANFMIYKGPNGDSSSSFSVATWTRGAETLLPKVDRIAFVRLKENNEPSETKMVAWDHVMQWLSDSLEAQDLYPVRYRTRGFPDDGLLARMPEVK